jgi:hypothetical protein
MKRMIALVGGAAVLSPVAAVALQCNGHEALCSKRYNEVTFAATHDAYASDAYVKSSVKSFIPGYRAVAYIGFVDQKTSITKQLEDGVRALDLRIAPSSAGGYALCHARHSICQTEKHFLKKIGEAIKAGLKFWEKSARAEAKKKLDEALFNIALAFSTPDAVFGEIRKFVDGHPNDVVTVFAGLIGKTPASYLKELLDRHGLTKYLHQHTWGKPWATLGEMVESGKRLVVFGGGNNDAPDGSFPSVGAGWQDKWKSDQVVSDCGSSLPANLPVDVITDFSHHLTMSIARLKERHLGKDFGTKDLVAHLQTCYRKHSRWPTYISVDFYNETWAVRMAEEISLGKLKPAE